MSMKKQYQDVKVGLAEADRKKLAELSLMEGRSKTEVARDAIRWYLDHYEQIKGQSKEGEYAQGLTRASDQLLLGFNRGVERICKMLSRQGKSVQTLYELTYMSLPDTPEAIAMWKAAETAAIAKMGERVSKDEKDLSERSARVVTS